MLFQIVLLVGAVVAASMIAQVLLRSLVGRQVDLFVPLEVRHQIGAVAAALMVTLMSPGSLVGRQVGLFVCLQMVRGI